MKFIVLMCLFFGLACSSNPVIDRNPQQTQCVASEKHPQLFDVISTNSELIVVRLNNFAKFFGLSNQAYDFNVKYIETKILDRDGRIENKTYEVLSGQIAQEPYTLKVPVNHGGIYHFELAQDGKVFWKQKVFALPKKENTLSVQEKDMLAKQFAPVIEMSPHEMYYPTSLDYLFNKVDSDSELAKEPFRLTTLNTNISKKSDTGLLGLFTRKYGLNKKFSFSEIDQILPYYGHAESVLKSNLANETQTRLKQRYGKNHVTLYYSVFENKLWNEIYINYHMFYAYDSKNATHNKNAIAAHIFDRESITVVLRASSKKLISVIYGAHLPSQKMAQLDSQKKVIQHWETGRVFVPGHKAPREHNRVKAVAAKGSHGIYPIKGLYAVLTAYDIPLLLEPAGGGEKLYPDFDFPGEAKLVYKLRPLYLDNISSHCSSPNRMLVFSGSTVDVLGPINATFPPFTDREGDYKNYTDPNAPMFDIDLGVQHSF